MQKHEDVIVFSLGDATPRCKNPMVYNPQGLIECNESIVRRSGMGLNKDRKSQLNEYTRKYTNYPTSILKIPSESKTIHPTQKPVALFEYLIKTYTNEGDVVLDPCAGSFTTAVAAINTNRGFICIEKDKGFFDKGVDRVNSHLLRINDV